MPYAKLDEIELYYEEAGEGYPIVLGHGGFSDITEWDPQVEALSKRFRVIRYDRRGCGRSRPRDVPQLAELWVEDLRRFMLNLGLERAYLGGVSYGGMLLIEFLLKHQEMCRAALIVSATARGREKTSERSMYFPNRLDELSAIEDACAGGAGHQRLHLSAGARRGDGRPDTQRGAGCAGGRPHHQQPEPALEFNRAMLEFLGGRDKAN